MSQQEFSQFQGSQSSDDQIDYTPYYWSTKSQTEGVARPKDEPAPRHDEPMVQSDYEHDYQHSYQSGYIAQHNEMHSSTVNADGPKFQSQAQAQEREQSRRGPFSPDGDAFESQYRPNNSQQQWSVPVWARPQVHRRSWRRVALLIVLGIILIKPALLLFAILGGLALVIILPILLMAFALLIPFALVFIVGLPFLIFHLAMRRSFPQRRGRYTNYWRRPDPWRW